MKKQVRKEPADESFEMTFIGLMLLLLCFMVIMVSLAQLEGPRFRKAIGSVKGALSMLSEASGTSMLADEGPGVLPHKGGVGSGDPAMRGESLEQLKSNLKEMAGENLDGMIHVEDTGSRLNLTLGSLVLFDRGDARFRAEADPILREVGNFLADWPGQVKVIGYTCDLPIRTARFPSNWDLSVARAVAVVRYLSDGYVEGRRLRAIGVGESRPLVSNDREDHRAMNRRVEILLEYGDEGLSGEETETAWEVEGTRIPIHPQRGIRTMEGQPVDRSRKTEGARG